MKLNLIMTTRNLSSPLTERFLNGLKKQPVEVKEKIHLFAVIQHEFCGDKIVDGIEQTVIVAEPCSLSHARNIGLKALPNEEGIVCFPDDDCYYNETVLKFVLDGFQKEKCDIFSTGYFDPITGSYHGRNRTPYVREVLTEKNMLEKPVSSTIFVKYNTPNELPLFDERFGVGTEWGSGEETDFILELYAQGKKGVYNSNDFVYHDYWRDKDENITSITKYTVGFAVMMQKSLILRGQKIAYKSFRKILFRTFVATVLYMVKPAKRKVYSARFKGYKKGIKIGKKYFKNATDK